MVQYAFKSEFQTIRNAKRADPKKIGRALQKVQDEAPGEKGYPQRVVDAARNPRNALHKHFTWDDQEAAEAYRRDEARTIIRSIRIVDDEGDDKPAFISVSSKGGQRYHSLDAVMASAELQLAVLKSAERDLAAFEKRYTELADICRPIQKVRDKLRQRIEESRPSA